MADEREEIAEEVEEEIEIADELKTSPALGELEEWEEKRRRAERDKVGLVEALLLLMLAATADVFEIIAGLTVVLWIIGLILGLFVSGVIFMWAVLRGGSTYLIFRRVIITVGGWLLDAALLGILPIRTIALFLTIWINNRDASRRGREAIEKIEEISKGSLTA
ncbi:MAG: hypothetical protein HYY99_01420 [Candidatus Colwellbacteria bacterium]|nr:hypothetical protein [Candidatus Colwellbacteria bacterium]